MTASLANRALIIGALLTFSGSIYASVVVVGTVVVATVVDAVVTIGVVVVRSGVTVSGTLIGVVVTYTRNKLRKLWVKIRCAN